MRWDCKRRGWPHPELISSKICALLGSSYRINGPSSTLKPSRQNVRCRIAGGASAERHNGQAIRRGCLGGQTLCIWVRNVGALHVITPKGVSATRKQAARSVICGWTGSSVAVYEMINLVGCVAHSAALRKRSCTKDPPGRLGRPGFSTDIPLKGGGSERYDWSRGHDEG